MQLITTPNPNAKKIEIEHGLEVGTVIKSTSDKNNTLCNQLISISGISTIFAGPGFLTLTKEENNDWDNEENKKETEKLDYGYQPNTLPPIIGPSIKIENTTIQIVARFLFYWFDHILLISILVHHINILSAFKTVSFLLICVLSIIKLSIPFILIFWFLHDLFLMCI